MYIGITEISMFIISSLLFTFGHKHHLGTISETNAIVNLCLSGTLVVMVTIMFLGLKRENSNYLIPHLAWQIVTIIGLVVGLLFTFLYQDADSDVAILVTVVVVVITRLCLQVYFFTVVFRCCMFFYDKSKNFNENQSSARATENKEVSDEEFWNYHPATEFIKILE